MFSKFEMTSWKSSIKSALVQSFLSVIFCIIYTYIILFFTDGSEFFGKQPTQEINGIRSNFVLTLCGILASAIPILLIKYKSAKYLLAFIPLSIVFYLIFMLLCILFVIDDNFDLIAYSLSSVPIGSGIGTYIAIVLNQHKKKLSNIKE